jgi:hypothetical protein
MLRQLSPRFLKVGMCILGGNTLLVPVPLLLLWGTTRVRLESFSLPLRLFISPLSVLNGALQFSTLLTHAVTPNPTSLHGSFGGEPKTYRRNAVASSISLRAIIGEKGMTGPFETFAESRKRTRNPASDSSVTFPIHDLFAAKANENPLSRRWRFSRSALPNSESGFNQSITILIKNRPQPSRLV